MTAHNPTAEDPTPAGDESRVDALIAEMTLEEKIGQLGSYWFDRRGAGEVIAPMQDTLGAGRPPFEQAAAHGLGHLTRIVGTEPVPAAEGREKLAQTQARLMAGHRLGLPAIAHEECLTGVAAFGATVYPIPLAWGATFDPELVEQVGSAIGDDLRALGAHQGLAPVLDVVRDYRWGRVEETIGEDPHLVGTVGSAYVHGMESTGTVATLKHFVGYSASQAGRNHGPVSAGPREVADVLLPPFEMAIRDGGARSVMNSYSAIDGVPVAGSVDLLTRVLRDEWGFEGTVVSDYWAIPFLATTHGVAADAAEAAGLALRAGLDVELPDAAAYGRPLLEAVRAGSVPEELVDRALRRVLAQKEELGLLDPDTRVATAADDPIDLDSPRNREIARRVAEESIVLLANDSGALPLRAGAGSRIALVGPCAEDPRVLMGCYSYPVHVLPRHPELGLGLEVASIADAVRAEFAGAEVSATAGCAVLGDDRSGIDEAVAAAEAADVVVLAVGDRSGMFGRGSSGEGSDAPDLHLPGVQDELVERVLATGTPVVLLVVSGRPYALGAWKDRAVAVVQAFMPGAEGASAVAGVLSGRINPSGKLPVQVPDRPTSGPQTYLGTLLSKAVDKISNLDLRPAYPFGHGLSYTSFSYSDLTLSAESVERTVEVTVTVRNTGERDGDEVVQLYLSDLVASVNRPVRFLAGYRRIAVPAGEARTVTFTVDSDLLAFTGIEGRRIVEPGEVRVAVGGSSEGDWPSATYVVTGATREAGHDRAMRAGVRVAG